MNVNAYYPDDTGFPEEAFVANHLDTSSFLQCPICFKVLNDPRQCNNKLRPHSFCQGCITASLESNQRCPVDQQSLTLNQLNVSSLKYMVDELQVYCCTKGRICTSVKSSDS